MAKAHRAVKVARSAQLSLILRAAVFGGAYLAAADLSTLLQIEPGPFRCVWLPAGLYLAVLVISSRKDWIWFVLAALVAGLTFDRLQGHSWQTGFAHWGANSLQALVGAVVLARCTIGRPTLATLREVLGLTIAAALGSALIGAVLRVALRNAVSGDPTPGSTWTNEWASHALGILAVSPGILAWAPLLERPPRRRSWPRILEFLLLMVALLLGVSVVFGARAAGLHPWKFLLIPILLWLGLRFGPRGAALGAGALALIAPLWHATHFPQSAGQETLVLQMFIGIAAFTSLTVAAVLNESHQNNTALRESQERLSLALDAAQLGIWEVDLPRRTVYWSETYAGHYGRTSAQAPDTDVDALACVHPEDRSSLLRQCRRAVTASAPCPAEFRVVWPDGSIHWHAAMGRALKDETGRAVKLIGVGRNIDERKAAEAERQLLNVQLRQAHRLEAIGTLAGGIAHDFNNALGAIVGNTELAIGELPPDHPAQEFLQDVEKGTRRATDLVRQILAFVRQTPRQPQSLALSPIVKEALKFLRATIPANIDVRSDFRSATPNILADPTQVYQVVMNLATNAVHAMKDHGGRLSVSLGPETLNGAAHRPPALAGLPEGPYVRLSVSDTGHGMDSATLQKVFDPFFSTKAPEEGTGLGLAVVDGILKASHGGIVVTSQPGSGTEFHLYFPAHQKAAPGAESAGAPIHRGRGETVLLVEDDPALSRSAQRTLASLGYQVLVETDAEAALRRFHDTPHGFDLVITDLSMPGMSGMQLARKLRALRPQQRVVLVSGDAGSLASEDLKQLGLTALLEKPVTAASLGRTVADALRPQSVLTPL